MQFSNISSVAFKGYLKGVGRHVEIEQINASNKVITKERATKVLGDRYDKYDDVSVDTKNIRSINGDKITYYNSRLRCNATVQMKDANTLEGQKALLNAYVAACQTENINIWMPSNVANYKCMTCLPK